MSTAGKLQEVINAAVAAAQRSLLTWLPAKVVKWDADKGRVDCQILIKEVTEGEDESREVNSWPVVTGVPVQFVGAGGFRLTCPVVKGTTGTLFFSARSLDKWLTGTGGEVDPEFDHDHALTDAVFMPGLKPFGAPWASIPDHGTIGVDDGVQIHFHSATIVIGDEAGSDFIALAAKVKAWFDTFNAAVTGWTPAPNDGGAALKTALGPLIGGSPSTDVAASQAKAK